IVPVSRRGERRELVLIESDALHGIPAVADVAGGAPQIAADLRAPLPDVDAAVLTQAEYDLASGLFERVAHALIECLLFGFGVHHPGTAPIIFQVIDSPGSPSFGVVVFVGMTRFVTGAGCDPGA